MANAGFLCGACDTPLPAGAKLCLQCRTPIAWEETPVKTAAAAAPPVQKPPAPAPKAPAAAQKPLAAQKPPVAKKPPVANAATSPPPKPRPAAQTPAPIPAPTAAAAAFVAPAPTPSRSPDPAADKAASSWLPFAIGVGVIVIVIIIGVVFATKGKSDQPVVAAAPTTATTAKPTTTIKTPVTTATASPSSSVTPTTAKALPTTTRANKTAAFCAAQKTYSLADLLNLANHIVSDPAGFLAAYDVMVANAPADLATGVGQLGPLTRTGVAVVQSGKVTTPEEMKQWLIDAPRGDVEGWVKAQQEIAPAVLALCP